jgi:hypothetical protein
MNDDRDDDQRDAKKQKPTQGRLRIASWQSGSCTFVRGLFYARRL